MKMHYYDYIKKVNQPYSEGIYTYCGEHVKKDAAKWYKENEPQKYEDRYKKMREKLEQHNLEKYGVKNIMQTEYGKEKLKQSLMDKYGVTNIMKLPETRIKMAESMGIGKECLVVDSKGNSKTLVNCAPCSKNQKHIASLYNGEINAMISGYSVDILLDNNIYFEYNGQGHRLSVILGSETQEEFDKKEYRRYYILKQHGYKQALFISEHHRILPSDEVLLSIKDLALQYLSIQKNNWIEFNFDTYKIRTKNNEIEYSFDHPIKEDEKLKIIN